MRRPRWQELAWVALLVLALMVPFLFEPFRVGQFTLAVAYAVAVLGLNLLVGYSGQISLGHGAFFALGAYTAAILIEKASVPHLLTLPAAAVLCALAGFALGLPALRLRGLYLALVTLGVALAVPQVIKRWQGLTAGTQGINVKAPTPPGFLSWLDPDQYVYLLTLGVACLMFAMAAALVRGSVGRALAAVRENELAARALGVDLARYKTRAFAVSAAYAGVAGALYVFNIAFVAPESFGIAVSFQFLAAVVVGGLATVAGAVFGGLFIEFVPTYASDVNEALTSVIYGGVLIVCMYLLPTGIAGLGGRLARRAAADEPTGRERHDQESDDRLAGRAGGAGAGDRGVRT